MTHTQFRRMQIFALRMSRLAIGGRRWQKELYARVASILCDMASPETLITYRYIGDWEQASAEAEGQHYELLCDFIDNYCSRGNTKRDIALRCCLRAACDVATSPSDGVLGFTAGEIRAMWAPKPVPSWVTDFFADDFSTFRDVEPVWL